MNFVDETKVLNYKLLFLFSKLKKIGAAEEGVVPALIALLIGSILSAAIYYSSTEEEPPRFYGALCFVGFLVAITWIFLVANEVVGVLQAFGMIFGVSDAILGLTIFAMVSISTQSMF